MQETPLQLSLYNILQAKFGCKGFFMSLKKWFLNLDLNSKKSKSYSTKFSPIVKGVKEINGQ